MWFDLASLKPQSHYTLPPKTIGCRFITYTLRYRVHAAIITLYKLTIYQNITLFKDLKDKRNGFTYRLVLDFIYTTSNQYRTWVNKEASFNVLNKTFAFSENTFCCWATAIIFFSKLSLPNNIYIFYDYVLFCKYYTCTFFNFHNVIKRGFWRIICTTVCRQILWKKHMWSLT